MAKKASAFRKCGVFLAKKKRKKALPSANAEGKKQKKIVCSESRTRVHNFAVHHSTHYSIPLSMVDELKIVDINKLKIFFSS